MNNSTITIPKDIWWLIGMHSEGIDAARLSCTCKTLSDLFSADEVTIILHSLIPVLEEKVRTRVLFSSFPKDLNMEVTLLRYLYHISKSFTQL
jgi:hypothetical protein